MSRAPSEQGDSQQFVITLLAVFGRRFDESLWSGGLVRLLEDAGYSAQAARAALNRLVVRGLLERRRDGRHIFYTMTPHCQEVLAEGDRRLFSLDQQAEWNGAWTLVLHAVPEDQSVARHRLGRRLRFLGFRPVQDAIWLSPHDRGAEVRAVTASLGVQTQVAALVGTSPVGLPVEQLVDQSWDLDGLCRRYDEFADRWGRRVPARSRRSRRPADDRDAYRVRVGAAHEFRQFALLDPELPDPLLPRPAARHRAAEAFTSIMSELEAAGARHFADAMRPDPARS